MKETSTIKYLQKFGRDKLNHLEPELGPLETDLLLTEILRVDRIFLVLHPDERVPSYLREKFFDYIEQRVQGVPMAYLLGHKGFMGYDFYVEKGLLIPRNDTQVVIELADEGIEKILMGQGKSSYKLKKQPSLFGVEIGLGTGIISLNLLAKHREIQMIGGDINPLAIEISRKNALYVDEQILEFDEEMEVSERFEALESDLFQQMNLRESSVDFIISNPPYIVRDVIATLEIDIKDYEPVEALDGGEDGLDFYKKILNEGNKYLKRGGFFAFEIGYDQGAALKELMEQAGLVDIVLAQDLAGLDRGIIGYKK